MTDSDRSRSEVPALIEERRRYEGWLAALEARRDSTPGHVFERVQADYRTRLQRVADQIASHRQAIEEDRASVESRLTLLAAEEQLHRDERAELELRAHVGELAAVDADSAFKRVDSAIVTIVSEKESLHGRVAELRALLDEGAKKEGPVQKAEASAAPSVTVEVAQPAPQPEPTRAPEPAAPVAQQPDRPRVVGGSFDELAFLSSVVGKGERERAERQAAKIKESQAAAPVAPPPPQNHKDQQITIEHRSSEPVLKPRDLLDRDDQPGESLLSGIDKRPPGDLPLGANVPGHTPIVLRPTGTIEQAKTLKCNECGAMNYPTEWYCERCGAELAAL